MHEEEALKKLLKELQKHDIMSTPEFMKDLKKLVKTDLNDFIQTFFRDFSRKEFKKHNRFEKLKISNKEQRRKLHGAILMRYEYRKNSNLRCIFAICTENNIDIPILLCAFNEDGDKKTGKTSYNKNIERAINILNDVLEE